MTEVGSKSYMDSTLHIASFSAEKKRETGDGAYILDISPVGLEPSGQATV